MDKAERSTERMSIDIQPEEHRRIKAFAALHGKSLRQYVLESVRDRLQRETRGGDIPLSKGRLADDPVLRKLWNNTKDSRYDRL